MSKELLGSYSISQEFTADFAKLSGDSNPLHVDPVVARRYPFGSTVVHGICGSLKALDLLLEKLSEKVSLNRLKIQFNRPIRHGEIVDVYSISDQHQYRLELVTGGKRSQVLSFSTSSSQVHLDIVDNVELYEQPKINHHSFNQAALANGYVDLVWNKNLLKRMFPSLATKLRPSQTATLLGTTVVVGMKCPGINSIFGGLDLSFSQADEPFHAELNYRVASSDERFNRLQICVENSACSGEIEAFYRAPPVVQSSFKQIQQLLPRSQFRHQTALVIGGSRGLGEVIAKILAAGGAKTTITYAHGKHDAERVATEISDGGGICSTIHYNVLSSETDLSEYLDVGSVTHIYYLASPLIEKSEQPIWDARLFEKYCSYYLSGLSGVLTECAKKREYKTSPLNIFVPSTIFLSEPVKGFAEYCAAKAAAETLAQNLAASKPNWRVHSPRLQRMQTDQTSGVEMRDSMESASILLKELSTLSS